jgi:hypothetical protein
MGDLLRVGLFGDMPHTLYNIFSNFKIGKHKDP